MNNTYHQFNKSQKTEVSNTYLHDLIYKKLLNKYNIEIDRDSCDYRTLKGKEYQQADTDTILKITSNTTKECVCKNVSEKTRNMYYDDIYMEIISVLLWNNVTQEYEFNKIGWGMKNDTLGPDYLSLLFLNKKEEMYNSVFIKNYKKLKNDLFIKNNFFKLVENEDFLNLLNNCIKLKPKDKNSFSVNRDKLQINESLALKLKNLGIGNGFKNIVFALNKDYYTIGLTYSTKYLKVLGDIKELSDNIPKLTSVLK